MEIRVLSRRINGVERLMLRVGTAASLESIDRTVSLDQCTPRTWLTLHEAGSISLNKHPICQITIMGSKKGSVHIVRTGVKFLFHLTRPPIRSKYLYNNGRCREGICRHILRKLLRSGTHPSKVDLFQVRFADQDIAWLLYSRRCSDLRLSFLSRQWRASSLIQSLLLDLILQIPLLLL